MQNGTIYYDPLNNVMSDTSSNINMYHLPSPAVPTMSNERKNKALRLLTGKWLDSWGGDLYPYIVVDQKKPRWVRSRTEWMAQSKNLFQDVDLKSAFLRESMTKSVAKKMIIKVLDDFPQCASDGGMFREKLCALAKRFVIGKVKENRA
jgi:hypothetical protein